MYGGVLWPRGQAHWTQALVFLIREFAQILDDTQKICSPYLYTRAFKTTNNKKKTFQKTPSFQLSVFCWLNFRNFGPECPPVLTKSCGEPCTLPTPAPVSSHNVIMCRITSHEKPSECSKSSKETIQRNSGK